MGKGSAFLEYVVHDVLADMQGITSRAMFGGHAIYKEGKIFLLIIDDELYAKANESTKDFFEARGSHRFSYTNKHGKVFTMNYYVVPEEVMEQRDECGEWMSMALRARAS
jgi:DNA transformation protein